MKRRKQAEGVDIKKEEIVENIETREQTLKKLEFYIPMLTDAELRMVTGFARGIKKVG